MDTLTEHRILFFGAPGGQHPPPIEYDKQTYLDGRAALIKTIRANLPAWANNFYLEINPTRSTWKNIKLDLLIIKYNMRGLRAFQRRYYFKTGRFNFVDLAAILEQMRPVIELDQAERVKADESLARKAQRQDDIWEYARANCPDLLLDSRFGHIYADIGQGFRFNVLVNEAEARNIIKMLGIMRGHIEDKSK